MTLLGIVLVLSAPGGVDFLAPQSAVACGGCDCSGYLLALIAATAEHEQAQANVETAKQALERAKQAVEDAKEALNDAITYAQACALAYAAALELGNQWLIEATATELAKALVDVLWKTHLLANAEKNLEQAQENYDAAVEAERVAWEHYVDALMAYAECKSNCPNG